MQTYEHLTIDVQEGGIVVLALNNPARLNALSFAIYGQLAAALDEIAALPGLRALVLWGGEKVFGAGADITDLQGLDSVDAGYRCSVNSHAVCDRIENLPVPTIAAVAGFALGGCCELALACDIRIATPSAKFGLPESTLGLLPGSGGTQRLPKLVGRAKALEMMYFGDTVRAEEALRIGLVNRIVEEGGLYDAAMELAGRLKNSAAVAIGLIKAAVHKGYTLDNATGMELEARAFAALYGTSDAREGMAAFVEKRKPNFTGK